MAWQSCGRHSLAGGTAGGRGGSLRWRTPGNMAGTAGSCQRGNVSRGWSWQSVSFPICFVLLFCFYCLFFWKVGLQVSSLNLHIHKLNVEFVTYWGCSFVWLIFCGGDFCKSYEIIRNYGTCRSSFSMLEKETLAVTSSLLQVLLVKFSAKYRAIWSYQT